MGAHQFLAPLEDQLFQDPLGDQPSLGAHQFLAPLEDQLFQDPLEDQPPLEAQLFLVPLEAQLCQVPLVQQQQQGAPHQLQHPPQDKVTADKLKRRVTAICHIGSNIQIHICMNIK